MDERQGERASLCQAKNGLEDEITCPLCLNIFEDPKILPCGHIYCKDPCLAGLVAQGNNKTITCPECRKIAHAHNGNVDSFLTAFHIKRLKDLHRSMNETAESSVHETPKDCQKHRGQELAIYCDTCKEVLCRDCLIATTDHHGHQYEYMDKAATRHREALRKLVEPAKALQKPLFHALIKIEETKADISRQQMLLGKDIDSEVDRLVQKLTEQRRNLHAKLSDITAQKSANVEAREQMLSKTHIELSECICTTEDAVENQSDFEFIFRMNRMKKQLQQITAKADQMPLKPVTIADTHLCTATSDALSVSSKQFYLCSGKQAMASKCTFQKESLRNAWVGQEIRLLIKVCDSRGADCAEKQNIVVELFCLRNVGLSLLSTSCVKPGQYLVQFIPQTRGRHVLGIKVNGSHIVGSPKDVFFRMPPQKLGVPVALIPQLKHPSSLACLNGSLLVCEKEGNQVVKFDSNFHRVLVVVKDLNKPTGIATDQDSNIYVTTTGDNLLHKLDRDGQHLLATANTGAKEPKDQLEFPHGVCARGNLVYICDSHHNKIKVYDTELNLKRSIGKKAGVKLGQFQFPLDITTDGEIYVTDCENHRIHVFDIDRDLKPNYKRAFGEMGNNPGQLNQPISLETYENFVFVTDSSNNRVSVFAKSGQFVNTFGEGYLSQPEGIAIDQDGFVYVCSHMKQIFVF